MNDKDIIIPKVIVKKSVYQTIRNHVYNTGFQYETGGILLGYRIFGIFYIRAATFSRCSEKTTRMTFILDGEEHTRQMEMLRKGFWSPLDMVGVWHSHTTNDTTLSAQDMESNKLLSNSFGEIVSIIVTQRGADDIWITPYYVSINI